MKAQNRYDSLFRYYGYVFGVDWCLLKAQALVESGLNPKAKSSKGALGLAQFMPSTWIEWGEGDILCAEDSIKAQARYMKWLLDQFKDSDEAVKWALASYNWGIGNVKKIYSPDKKFSDIWEKLPSETQRYVAKVFYYRAKIRRGLI